MKLNLFCFYKGGEGKTGISGLVNSGNLLSILKRLHVYVVPILHLVESNEIGFKDPPLVFIRTLSRNKKKTQIKNVDYNIMLFS